MKILIIGSSGFIGSHLCGYFRKLGHAVISCDVLDDPQTVDYYRVEKVHSDYTNVLERHHPDACIYAGGNGSVPFSLADPAADFQLNCINVFNILEGIRRCCKSCKFIHISSAAVYGNPVRLPVREVDPVHPLSPYGWHKFFSEQICLEYYQLYAISTISLRVFSVYGERLTKQIFWDIHEKIKRGKQIELFGTGDESRDFIFIDDLLQAMNCILNNAPFNGEIINVASGIETSIREASNAFCKLYDPLVSVRFNGRSKPGDPLHWRADITRLRETGFKHSVHLSEGLSRYIVWLKEKESH